jgi:hypothetical protein
MSSGSRAQIGRDYAYLCFGPPALLCILLWYVENVPMSTGSQQGYQMVFGLPLVMASAVALPAALVLAGIYRREWPLLVLVALTVGLVAATVTESPGSEAGALVYGLVVLASQALWFFWRRRRTAADVDAAAPRVLSIR